MTLEDLNRTTDAGFAATLEGIFEHAPWVAWRAATRRPYATVDALHDGLMQTLRAAPEPEIRAFLDGHPELASGRLAGELTPDSEAEQRALGVLGSADLAGRNAEYRARFGFPFIVCAARHTAANVLRQLDARLPRDPAAEWSAALAEIGHITRLRLAQRLPDAAPRPGRLSGHALDMAAGRPAHGLRAVLLQEGRAVADVSTDADGRIGAGLLPPGPLRQGRYELEFHAGAYFAARSVPTFYDTVPVRFVISDSEAHYHVPLLLAPFGYSTYRGS